MLKIENKFCHETLDGAGWFRSLTHLVAITSSSIECSWLVAVTSAQYSNTGSVAVSMQRT